MLRRRQPIQPPSEWQISLQIERLLRFLNRKSAQLILTFAFRDLSEVRYRKIQGPRRPNDLRRLGANRDEVRPQRFMALDKRAEGAIQCAFVQGPAQPDEI